MNWRSVTVKTRKYLDHQRTVAAFVVVYLAWVAAYPSVLDRVSPLASVGSDTRGSVATITIAAVMVGLACAVAWQAAGIGQSDADPVSPWRSRPSSALLRFRSLRQCHDEAHQGSSPAGRCRPRRSGRPSCGGHLCPAARWRWTSRGVQRPGCAVRRVSGITGHLLESSWTGSSCASNSSITAVVGADDDADSTVSAIADPQEEQHPGRHRHHPADNHRNEHATADPHNRWTSIAKPDALLSGTKRDSAVICCPSRGTNHQLGNQPLPAARHIRRPSPYASSVRQARRGGPTFRRFRTAGGRVTPSPADHEATAQLINRIVEQHRRAGSSSAGRYRSRGVSRRRLRRNCWQARPPLLRL